MTELETRVCIVVADDLGLHDVAVTDDLVEDHGIDELALQSVAMRLEEEFGLEDRSVSEEALIFESTVGKCVELVSHALDGDRGHEKGAADRSGRPILFVTT
jgi:acyl carrier protein